MDKFAMGRWRALRLLTSAASPVAAVLAESFPRKREPPFACRHRQTEILACAGMTLWVNSVEFSPHSASPRRRPGSITHKRAVDTGSRHAPG